MEDFIRTYTIDEKVVDDLVEYFDQYIEDTKPGVTGAGLNKNVKDSQDLKVCIEERDQRIVNYNQELGSCIAQYRNDFLEAGFPSILRVSPYFNIQKYHPMGGFKKWHCERSNFQNQSRQLVFMTYLNSLSEGGETEFFYQKVKIKPTKGLTLIWPSDFTHTHRGVPATNDTKIIATGWITNS